MDQQPSMPKQRPSTYGALSQIINANTQQMEGANMSSANRSNKSVFPVDISSDNVAETADEENIEWPYEATESSSLIADNVSPLKTLHGRRNVRENSITSFFARRRASTISSIKTNYYKVVKYRHFKLFLSMFLTSFFLYIGFTLAFLPRTSLSRDFRRLHFSQQFTKPEIYRIYTDELRNRKIFPELVRNFSSSNNLIGDDILLQSTYTYLDEKLNLKPNLEYYPFKKNLYNIENGVKMYDPKTGESVYEPKIKEPCFDSTSCDSNSLETYVFSSSGDYFADGYGVEVGIGTMDNYKNMISVEEQYLNGKIHIIRLSGNISLVSQIKNSISFGAIGCIVYNEETTSDQDYYFSNTYISRESIINEDVVFQVPVISLSYQDTKPILEHLRTIPLENQNKLRLTSKNSVSSKEVLDLKNIVVTIPGIWKSNEIVIGYQRDLFTYKGVNSAHLIFLEICRGLSSLSKKGWKPLRTIKLISFDGDTYDNLGSKTYLSKHNINEKSLVFIDIDKEAVTGNSTFKCRGNSMLSTIIKTAAKSTPFCVADNQYDETDLYQEFLKIAGSKYLNLNELDSNSRAFQFYSQNGIPTISCGFSGDVTFPHNSNYISMELFEDIIDPNYTSHSTLAEFFGLLALEIDEREVVGYKMGRYFSEIKKTYDELLNKYMKDDDKYRNDEKYFNKIDKILDKLITIFDSIDIYNSKLQHQTTIDYPWYHLMTKVQLIFKIKSLNRKLLKVKQLFYKGEYENPLYSKDIIMQPNAFTGNKLEILGELHEFLEIYKMNPSITAGLSSYLEKLYERLSNIKEYTLDIYPYD